VELNVAANYHNNNRLFAYVLVWLGARKLHSVESRRVVAGLHLAIGLGPSPLSRPVNSATSESRVAIQKYRDEVENDRKPGGVRMAARVCVGNFPSSASQDQFRQLRSTHGGVALVCKTEAESPEPVRGLGGSDLAVLAEPELEAAGARLALVETPVERPIWVNGTLPGTMAGKRPAPRTTRSN
jgi:hypothetical protein